MKSNILELGLKAILEEQRETLTDSLLAACIDVESGIWDHAKVVWNAQRSMELLSIDAEREGSQYLRIILDGLKKEEYLSTMAYIYIVSECNDGVPPLGIIQHAIDAKLLKEYCVCLKEIIARLYQKERPPMRKPSA